MKRLFIFTGLCLLGVSVPALAATPNSSASPVVNPALAVPPAPTPTPIPTPIYSPAPKLDAALKKTMLQISKDLKVGKLTKAQATSYRGQVVAIRKQELTDIKANGKRQLTSAQESQLTQQLSLLQPSL